MAQQDILAKTLEHILVSEDSPIADANELLKEGASFRFRAGEFISTLIKLGSRFVPAPETDFVPHIEFEFPDSDDFLALDKVREPRAFGERVQAMNTDGRLHIHTIRSFVASWEVGLGPWLQVLGILTPPTGYPELISSLRLKDIAFTEILDVNYIQELVDELARIIDVRLWVLDMNSIPIAVSATGGAHCKLIINSLEGVQRCYCSAIDGIAELKKTLAPRVRKCHAGFICMDAPLILNGEMVGIITGDASLPESPEPEVYRALAQELDIDAEELVDSLVRVRRLNLDEIEFILSVVNAMGQVVTEMSFKQYMLSEKVRELSGLNRISSLLSNHLSTDLEGVYGNVASEIATLKEGTHCELELKVKGKKRVFSSNGDNGAGNGDQHSVTIDIKTGNKKRGSLTLKRPGTLDAETLRENDQFLDSIGSQISMALQNVFLYYELEEKNRELRNLLRSMNDVVENERTAIARDLHDDTGQNLTNALLSLKIALSNGASLGENRAHLESVAESISLALKQLHDVSVRLHPPILDDLGLIEAINNLLRRMNAEYPVSFCLKVSGSQTELLPEAQLNMYRIVQEAISNIVKHARATEATIHFTYHAGGTDILISDNGKGCPPVTRDQVHLGLITMKERTEQMGGTFSFMSSPSGATVAVHVPNRPKDDARKVDVKKSEVTR